MRHANLQDLLDELMDNTDEIVISSNSKHCALYNDKHGKALFLEGDFSGDDAQVEAEVRRVLRESPPTKVVISE